MLFRTLINLVYLASIADRSNLTNINYRRGSQLPEFSDVKIFIDSLLISYQKNTTISWNIQREVIRCTKYRMDILFGRKER